MYSPSIPGKRVFAVLVRWLCRHFVWGPCEDRTTESLRWFIYRSADIVSKGFLCDITFRNCPITAWVASGKASVSGLASLLKEDGTFLAVFCSRCNFRAKTRFQTLATQATQNMHFLYWQTVFLKFIPFCCQANDDGNNTLFFFKNIF